MDVATERVLAPHKEQPSRSREKKKRHICASKKRRKSGYTCPVAMATFNGEIMRRNAHEVSRGQRTPDRCRGKEKEHGFKRD